MPLMSNAILTSAARAAARYAAPLALVLVAASCGKACQGGRIAEVEGAILADAMGNIDPPEGALTIPILPDQRELDIPSADLVALAVDRRVPFGRVLATVEQLEESGVDTALLVGRRSHVRGFVLEDEHQGRPGVELLGFPSPEGWKSCVRPRGGDEAACAQQHQGTHIDAAGTRDLVREAVRAYNSRDVLVGIPVTLAWADAVRLIDGARTCCFDEEVRVEIVLLDGRGAPLSSEETEDDEAAAEDDEAALEADETATDE